MAKKQGYLRFTFQIVLVPRVLSHLAPVEREREDPRKEVVSRSELEFRNVGF